MVPEPLVEPEPAAVHEPLVEPEPAAVHEPPAKPERAAKPAAPPPYRAAPLAAEPPPTQPHPVEPSAAEPAPADPQAPAGGPAPSPAAGRDWRAGEAYPHGPHGHEPRAAPAGAAAGRAVADQPTVAFSLEDEHEATVPQPVSAGAAAGAPHPDRRTVSLPRARTPDVQDGHFYEAPIGTRRAGRSYSPQPGAGAPGYRNLTVPGGGGRGRGRRRWWIALVALALVVGRPASSPSSSSSPATATGRAACASSCRRAPPRARSATCSPSAAWWTRRSSSALRARLAGKRGDLRAGTFTLRRDMSYGGGPRRADDGRRSPRRSSTSTIPEGPCAPRDRAARQAGRRARGLPRGAARLRRRSPARLRRAAGTPSLEGFLFPATYELKRGRHRARRSWPQQLAAFKQNLAKVSLARASART